MNPVSTQHLLEPVQLLAFVLQSNEEWGEELVDVLRATWSAPSYTGKWYPFDQTHYYEPEMGSGLFRAVVAFPGLVDASGIAKEKRRAMEVEARLAASGGRRFNIDVGYMDTDKIVLPSVKRGPKKIYWGEGVWLDAVMQYAKGRFTGTDGTFEDFVRNPYHHDLLLIRERFKRQLKNLRMDA